VNKSKPQIPEGAKIYREFFFDEDHAAHAEAFFENYLRHSKGEWAGQLFELSPWQREIIRELFGWRRIEDGTRRYRMAYVEIPRKNGKSTFAAGLALYLATADEEPGAEVYSAAGDKDQASIVFKEASEMVRQCRELNQICEVQTKAIVVAHTTSVYRVLSAEAFTKHGLNAHGIIFDELHAQPNRELWDVLTTSVGARRQPLTIAITTAGFDKNSICYELHDYAVKVRDGILDDPTFLAVIFAASPEDDWTDPATWRKANPSLGISVSEEYLAAECKKAKEIPGYENTFKRLHLNIWTEQETRWIQIRTWDENDLPRFSEAELRGRRCYIGLDLSTTTDIAAAIRIFPRDDGTFDIHPRFYVPSDNAEKRARRDRVPYPVWIREGKIRATPGNVIDYDFIKSEILGWSKIYDLREVAYDPWSATQIALQLEADGATCVPFRQGFQSMSEPSKTVEKLILGKKIRHGADPVLRWMFSNVAIELDPAGNIKPSKKRSTERIDGVIGLIMGVGRATLPDKNGPSVYAKRGLVSI
jgi:phage terminase large subunit-like protein